MFSEENNKISGDLLILTNTSGGLFLFRKELIQVLAKDHVIHVLTSDSGRIEELQDMGCIVDTIQIERRGMNPLKDFSLLRKYIKYIRKLKPSMVITYTVKPNVYGGICCRVLHIPYAANITGLGTGFQNKRIRKLLIKLYRTAPKNVKVVFCENASIKEELVNDRLVSEKKICVLNGAGVNLQRFYYQEYPEDNDVFHFLFIGRVMKEKGVNELLSVMERLNSEGFPCKLTVLGGFEENYEDRFSQLNWIDYKGIQKDVRPYIAEAHCFVLPSWHEGMANTNLECASTGRPVITSDIPGCREAVLDTVSGYLCKSKDQDDLYIKMKRMMNLSNDERKQMGLAGRRHMESNFNKEDVVKETIRYLLNK